MNREDLSASPDSRAGSCCVVALPAGACGSKVRVARDAVPTAAIATGFAVNLFHLRHGVAGFRSGTGERVQSARALLAGAAAFGAAFLVMAIAQANGRPFSPRALPLLPVAIVDLGIALLVELFAVRRREASSRLLALAQQSALGMFARSRIDE